MKALIPSHRENKRYLLIQGINLKKNVYNAIKEFVGILGLSEAVPSWIECNGKKGILSINRKSLEKVRAAFVITKDKIEILKVSGTLKALGA
jgi:RNase P/RNase MRP subunit POP5